MNSLIRLASITNRGLVIGVILFILVVTLATISAQSPQESVIVFYRVRPIVPVEGQSNAADQKGETGKMDKMVRGIRKMFDRNTPADPDQDPTIYQMTAGGATRLATISKGEFFELHVRPGHYAFSWTSGPSRGQQTIISINPGQRSFVQVQFRSITPVEPDAALADLKELHPVNSARVFDSAVRTPDSVPGQGQPVTRQEVNDRDIPLDQPIAEPQKTPEPQAREIIVRSDSPGRTLGAIRQTYLSQSIIVRGAVDRGMISEWSAARKTGDRYKGEPSRPIPVKYRGQTAKVIAVQLTDTGAIKPGAEDAIVDPRFELVAQLADGAVALTSARFETLADRATLASEQKVREAEMTKNLPLVTGKSLYATGLSVLYDPDTTIEEMTGSREILKRLSATLIPLFEPLAIVTARYIPAEDGVLLRLRLPDGREALAFTKASALNSTAADAPFIQKISGGLLPALPKELTAREVEAIKQGELFRGMSSIAVGYMFGLPESESAWGTGGKECVYLKQISIHFDNTNKVVDWEVLRTK